MNGGGAYIHARVSTIIVNRCDSSEPRRAIAAVRSIDPSRGSGDPAGHPGRGSAAPYKFNHCDHGDKRLGTAAPLPHQAVYGVGRSERTRISNSVKSKGLRR